MDLVDLRPGQRVRITQTIDRRERDWSTTVEGVIRSVEPQPTVSWFAHQPHGRLWLQRIELQKADGEVSSLKIDQHTVIELLGTESPETVIPAATPPSVPAG